MDGPDGEGVLYEFSAYLWMSVVRGRVRAADVFDARRKLRARGFRAPTLWRHGKKHPFDDSSRLPATASSPPSKPGVVAGGWKASHPLWRAALQREDRVVYTRRLSATILGGLAFIGFGSVLGGIAFAGRAWFMVFAGACVCLVGVSGLLLKPSLVVDRVSRSIRLGLSVLGLKWTRKIPTGDASTIGLDGKEFFSDDGMYLQYVVSVQSPEGDEWPIDASGSLTAQREMATAIAKCLQLPLKDSTGQWSRYV